MKLVVISTESDEQREHAVLAALFAAGLERYHVRKPHWSREKLATWLGEIPERWRSRLVLHQHHEFVTQLGLGGMHWRDDKFVPALRAGLNRHRVPFPPSSEACFTSRSCHHLATLDAALGRYDAVFFSPVFPSISKSGYQPQVAHTELSAMLYARTEAQRSTEVFALGGITPATVACCAELGFDGVAVLGALWLAEEPLKTFDQLQQSISAYVA